MYFELFSLGHIFSRQNAFCANILTIARATVLRSKGIIPQFAGRSKQNNNQADESEKAGRVRFHKYRFFRLNVIKAKHIISCLQAPCLLPWHLFTEPVSVFQIIFCYPVDFVMDKLL